MYLKWYGVIPDESFDECTRVKLFRALNNTLLLTGIIMKAYRPGLVISLV